MAGDSIPLYNFYRRYLWNETDFTNWQEGMVEEARGVFEGMVAASVLSGYDIAPSGATLAVTVQPGIASGPSGYMHVVKSVSLASMQAADATNPRRDLVVLRQLLTPDTAIQRPTAPYDSVYLRTLQQTQVVVIAGTAAATPVYPSAQANDVVLAGVRVAPTATSFATTDLDFSVRDTPGKHTKFQEAQAKYDRRLRPYLSSSQVLSIKPSQLFEGANWRSFIYVSSSVASRFPQDGTGKIQDVDATVNFQTGVIAGGDAISPDFTPHVPTAGNCVVVTVALNTDDTLNIQYGTTGTRAQCFAAIYNQTQAGAGAIVAPVNSMPIAYVVVSSKDGTNVTELDLVDARTPFSFTGATQLRRYPNVILAGDGTGDYTTLNAAVAALPSGGVIVLGSNTTVGTNVSIPDNTKIVGRRNLTLTISAGVAITCGANCVFEDVLFDATALVTGIAITAGFSNTFYNCSLKLNPAISVIGIYANVGRLSVEDCRFYGVVFPSLSHGTYLDISAYDYFTSNNTYSI